MERRTTIPLPKKKKRSIHLSERFPEPSAENFKFPNEYCKFSSEITEVTKFPFFFQLSLSNATKKHNPCFQAPYIRFEILST